MQVKWLRKALKNLDESASYIAKDNPEAARRFVATVESAIGQLETFPAVGRPGRIPGTRELVIQTFPYVVPYRVRKNAIEILRVFHTARELPKTW